MTEPASTHLDPDTIAAYVDGGLDASGRARAESHLATCGACRHELVTVQGILQSYRTAPRRLRFAIPLAAAAVLLLAIGLPLFDPGDAVAPLPPTRRPGGDATALAAISPLPGATLIAGTAVEFTWTAAEAGSTYRLTVVDEAGVPVWSTEGGDTLAVLPADVVLASGHTYFWYVDALRSDGRSLTLGAQRFSVR